MTRHVLVEINLDIKQASSATCRTLARSTPSPEYLRTGVPVCLNTDDRGMDLNLTDEYFTAVTQFHLSWGEILAMGRDSLARSFVQPEAKARTPILISNAKIADFEERYGTPTADSALASLAVVRPVAYGYARRTWDLGFN